MFKVFQYNNANGQVELATPEILLVSEFKALMDNKRNACKKDPKGQHKLRAFREFTYIWLAIDWQSVYADYPAQERHQEALRDAQLTDEEWEDPVFRAACRKYQALQESNRSIQMLHSAQNVIDKIKLYFDNIDLEERDDKGKPIYKVKDVQVELAKSDEILEALHRLEDRVKKEIIETSSIRAGAVDGYMPKNI